MANKTIFQYTLDNNPKTGNYLLEYDPVTQSTKRFVMNKLVALSVSAAEAIVTDSPVSGIQNVGNGQGILYSGQQTGMFNFRTLLGGSNVTITTSPQTVTINAADPPAVPLTALQNAGTGYQLVSGVQGTVDQIRSLVAGTGISLQTGVGGKEIIINAISGATSNISYQFVNAGVGFTGVPFCDFNGNGVPLYSGVAFQGGAPILSFPAGNSTYMIDWIFGVIFGSLSDGIWYKLRNTTAGADIAGPYFVGQDQSSRSQFVLKSVVTINGPANVQPFVTYTGTQDPDNAAPLMNPTGSSFSYIKLA